MDWAELTTPAWSFLGYVDCVSFWSSSFLLDFRPLFLSLPSVCLYSVRLSLVSSCLPVCRYSILSVCLYSSLSGCVPVFQPVGLSACIPVCLSVCLYSSLSVCPCSSLSVCISVSLSVYFCQPVFVLVLLLSFSRPTFSLMSSKVCLLECLQSTSGF